MSLMCFRWRSNAEEMITITNCGMLKIIQSTKIRLSRRTSLLWNAEKLSQVVCYKLTQAVTSRAFQCPVHKRPGQGQYVYMMMTFWPENENGQFCPGTG